MKKVGFTIVELLVVISVIGILAAITTVSYTGVAASARDAMRKSDLAAIENALELNYLDYGAYTQPENVCIDTSIGDDGCSGTITIIGDWSVSSDLRDLVADGYINHLPLDPINDSTYRYTYEPRNLNEGGDTAAGQGYTLCATALEATGSSYCIYKHK